MAQFIFKRILLMIPTFFVISLVSFTIIQLPPGDYLTSYVANIAAAGETVEADVIAGLEERFGLGQPFHVQYFKWMRNILTKGDFGQSFEWQRPVEELIWGSVATDTCPQYQYASLHMVDRFPDWHLFCRESILDWGLCCDIFWLYWIGNTKLPNRVDLDVHCVQTL